MLPVLDVPASLNPCQKISGGIMNIRSCSTMVAVIFVSTVICSLLGIPTAVIAGNPGIATTFFDDMQLSHSVATRTDAQLNFDWGSSSPALSVPADGFSARFQAYLTVPQSGDYQVVVASDDGAILFFKGQMALYDWNPHALAENTTSTFSLTAGVPYPLELFYFDYGGNATIQLYLKPVAGSRYLIPADHFSLPDESFPARDLATFNFTRLDPDGSLPVYTDSLAPNWYDWSYAMVSTAYTVTVHSGNNAIHADLDGWGAFCLFFSNGEDWSQPDYRGLSTRGFDRLSFWVHRGDSAGGQSVGVQLSDTLPGWEWRHRHTFTVPTDNEWHEIIIPLSELDGIDIGITRLAWLGNGNQTDAILLDDIRLLPAASPTATPRDPMTTTADFSWLYRDERTATLSTSWNEEHRIQGGTSAHGAFSLAARFLWYGALQFRPLEYVWNNPPAFNVQNANMLVFSFNRGANDNPNQRYEIYGLDKNGDVSFKAPVTRYLSTGVFDLDPATWQEVAVPVHHLRGSSDALYAVGIQEMSGVSGWTSDWLYLDEVRFEYRAPAADLILYSGSLFSSWNADGSWGATYDLAASSPVHGGTSSLTVTLSAPWGGLYLQTDPSFNSLDVRKVSFWIHGGTVGGQKIEVWVRDGSSVESPHVAITAPIANTWTLVEIPFSEFGNPTRVSAIAWQDASGAAQATFYLADITFSTLPALPPPPALQPGPVLSVDVSAGVHPISPYIYGMNFASEAMAATLRLPVRRWGGNATTRYNWQANLHNSGRDWYFENVPDGPAVIDGSVSDLFVEQDRRTGTKTLMTVPIMGWTARSDSSRSHPYACGYKVSLYSPQQSVDSWDTNCGNGVSASGAMITGNSPSDTSSVIDPSFVSGWLAHLTGKYGTATNGGVAYYNLDNEPMLWNSSHRDVHPEPTTYDELRDRTVQYGAAVKSMDSSAKTLGPALWGWCAYFYSALDGCARGTDYQTHNSTPFVPWYLQQMKLYEQQQGVRILDYLDLHYYPQANGVALASAGSAATQAMRLRSTRSLWDPTYLDESWINDTVRLIPRMHDWTNANYPGTGVAISEYNWGGMESINGALAQADILGIFGREGVELATLWAPPTTNQPGEFAFRIYRNYDGVGHGFGDTSIQAVSNNQDTLAVYAATRSSDNALTLVVINKSAVNLVSTVGISGFSPQTTASAFRYSSADLSSIQQLADQEITPQGFSSTFPAFSITLFTIPVSTCLVTFDSNGGSAVSGQTVVSGRTVMTPTAPTKVGNIFAGWYRDTARTISFDFTLPITTTTTLFAKWTPLYDITASLSGGNGTVTPLTQSVRSGDVASITITPNTGFKIASIMDNGNAVSSLATPYVITNVTVNHAVIVAFAASTSPMITGFTPVTGLVGSKVTITGSNLGKATVTFNGVVAKVATNSATSIAVTVPVGGITGPLGVTTATGTATSTGSYTVLPPAPTVTAVAPTSGITGSRVTITGTNFITVTAVKFNTTIATTVTVDSPTQITAMVPVGATTGKVSVVTLSGTGTSSTSFTLIGVPAITKFTPTTGLVGAKVTLTGTNLGSATGVTFNGVAATVVTNSATSIAVTVPVGAATGPLTVTTVAGTAVSTDRYTVLPPVPTVTAVAPASGITGSRVTITGTSFINVTAVKFHATVATTVTVDSPSQITAMVPVGTTTGTISVMTLSGTGTSSTSFTLIGVPAITKFTPTTGLLGAKVTITGTNLGSATGVAFNGVAAKVVTNSATSIAVTVPVGATTGPLTVTTVAGTATSTGTFTVTP
jgi:uncharacterized repeat protein (TIGR02543 family)